MTSSPNGPSTHDFAAMSVRDFCAALAAKTSAPGGGAVAGVTAAHAASLLAMVVEYSRGKPSFAALESEADAIVASLRIAAEAGLVAAKSDADAYAALSGLWKKPKDDPERIARWTSAVRDAIAAPHLIVELAAELAARCRFLAGRTTKARAVARRCWRAGSARCGARCPPRDDSERSC